jgi:hypothetical protein
MSIATYSFLPYLRQGIANTLQSTGESRGTLSVKLDVHGDAKSAPLEEKKIEIYGPGDVVGIDPRSVIKTDPHNWITNFEPNYLAYIDFYDEDLPWRYTPTPPAGQRLNPWIALVVLADAEFEEGQNLLNRPLPFFKLKSDTTRNFFPKTDQLWAWAHVHFNGDLTAADSTILTDNPAEVNTALEKLQSFLTLNPDFAYSRLVCPRKLLPNVSYNAFVIPAYESGRLAGTGSDAATIAAAKLKIAWQDPGTGEYPYYYRWKFNTGDVGDFEYLVELLKPKVADSRVGRRVMDMTKPGANLKWVEDSDPENSLGGILRLGGALKVPKESLTEEEIKKTKKFDEWAIKKFPDLHPFQIQIAGFLNLADDYNLLPANTANANAQTESDLPIDPNEDADPLVTPPIYGRWHAMVERVYKDRNGARIDNDYNWLNELNLDPRFRVPAHFGTRVVQENQEDFMQAAWEQIGEVLNANRQIRYGQFSIASSAALHAKHFTQANLSNSSKTMLLTAPLQKRIMFDGATVFHHVRQTAVPNVVLSAPMRRMVRPRGRLANQLQKQLPPGETLRLESIVTKISTGELLPAPPKILPPGLPSVDAVAGLLEPAGVPAFLKEWLRRFPWLPYVPLALALLIALLLILLAAPATLVVAGFAVAGGLVFLWNRLTQWAKDVKIADGFKSENKTPQTVGAMPKSSDFRLADLDENFTPTIGSAVDSQQAQLFKTSLKDMYRLFQLAKADIPKVQPPVSLQLNKLSLSILDQLRPEKTVPAWTWQKVFFPKWIKDQLQDEGFVEAMAYPKINTPMYESLKKISDELFLPNIELIEHNSITLLETNQHFIESYMVGLNHEFARELLWREYPTDQRGSYFRQFWDASVALKDPALKNKSEDEKREPYYDIPKLHEWLRKSKLGDHDNRQKPGEPPKEEVVLVIRGELLKKYPTAVIYAHKAAWTNNDTKIARSLKNADEGDKEKPDPQVVRTPLYQAKADPDIYFFGFDLTVPEVRGETEPETPTDENAGWFFVIKERPGEPRFGLDVPDPDDPDPELISWNDLNWKRVVPTPEGVIDVITLPPPPIKLPTTTPSSDGSTEQEGQKEQYLDDVKVPWNNNIDAANLAYILYQIPMMVAVHASEMLLKKKT